MENPYLEVFKLYRPMRADLIYAGGEVRGLIDDFDWPDVDDHFNALMARTHLCERFAYAVPDERAIQAIVDLEQPVVEVGAGTGYWAWLLRQEGVEVHAYDLHPNDSNEFCSDDLWTEVAFGDTEMVRRHPDAALLLCWPPMTDMATAALTAYSGDTVIYAGEWAYGCCADDDFFNDLGAGWDEVQTISIPQWFGIHDFLSIHKRRR